MSYLVPSEFVTKMVDAGESKIFMSTRDTVIRAFMAGAILALAAVFAVTVNVQTGYPIIGAILFPVGFCMLYLLGFDLLTGVFVLTPLALIDKRPGVTVAGVLRNWGLVFIGNFLGSLTVAILMSIVFTYGFTTAPDKVGTVIANIGEARTLGYASHGAAGMLTRRIEYDALRMLTQATSPGAYQTNRDAISRDSHSGLPACFACGAVRAWGAVHHSQCGACPSA